ncbi:hypothetical protein OSTOST_25099 [Ostertagia ostertagi]
MEEVELELGQPTCLLVHNALFKPHPYQVYQNASFEIVRSNHTTNLTGEQLNKTAKEEFNKAAKDFILKTIERAKQLRPNASWGLYGFPYCNYDAGKKGEYNCSEEFQQFNDE